MKVFELSKLELSRLTASVKSIYNISVQNSTCIWTQENYKNSVEISVCTPVHLLNFFTKWLAIIVYIYVCHIILYHVGKHITNVYRFLHAIIGRLNDSGKFVFFLDYWRLHIKIVDIYVPKHITARFESIRDFVLTEHRKHFFFQRNKTETLSFANSM